MSRFEREEAGSIPASPANFHTSTLFIIILDIYNMIMKTMIVSLFLTIAFEAVAAGQNTVSVEKYRKQYSALTVKWEKTSDDAKRKVIEKQIEKLKADNLHLFTKQ